MNPFDHLGVPRDSDAGTIRLAFRKLVKSVHPDHNQSRPEFVVKFQALKDAYELALSAAAARVAAATPDKLSAGPRRVAPIFRSVYRDVVLDVSQAMAGATISLDGAAGICSWCDGTGRLPCDHPISCVTCSGTGIGNVQSKGYISVRLQCVECEGTGTTTQVHCHHCGGFGVNSTQPCEVILPAGVRSGDAFKVEGAASIPEENVRGDIEIIVVVKDTRYKVVGDDIEATLWLDLWQALRGGVAPVRLPDGSTVKLTYPPSTTPGRRFTMKGKGMVSMDDFTTGDFVAVASIRPIEKVTPDVAAALVALEKAVAVTRTK